MQGFSYPLENQLLVPDQTLPVMIFVRVNFATWNQNSERTAKLHEKFPRIYSQKKHNIPSVARELHFTIGRYGLRRLGRSF